MQLKLKHKGCFHFSQARAFIHFGFVFILSTFLIPFGVAQATDDTTTASPGLSWHISADRITFDQEKNEYVAEGRVTITNQDRTLSADRVRLNQKSREAFAEGNIRLRSGKDLLSGQRLEMHLDNETGTLHQGKIFISGNHIYLSGEEIHKTGPATYSIRQATVTTCDGDDPDWRITGRDVEVTIEGYGRATHAALWAKKVPVLYTPYLVFPVKLKRQSGLLAPEFGLSDRKGTRYLQPLFWAINESSDATFFGDYMSLRGTRVGAEYRYVLSDKSLGAIMADGFNDRQVDDGQGDNSERWGYTDDGFLRPNSDRYWLRAKLSQALAGQFNAKLDLDLVSDQDYLQEFKEGFNGFDKTRAYFLETFGRDIDDYTKTIRLNRINFNRLWPRYTFNGDLRWYDDVIKRRQGNGNDTLQNLPAITFDGAKQPIASSGFFFDLTSSYTHFYRDEGARGHRADLYPRAYYPKRLFNVWSVEPSIGLRQTAWHIDQWDSPPTDRDTHYRLIYDIKLDTSTDFFRVFDFTVAGADRLKHAVRPQVIYEYTPDQDQSDWPKFDALDRIGPKNLISYSLLNTLITRSPLSTDKAADQFRYNRFLRFNLVQSFDINKYNEDDPEPFSNVFAELDITPGRYVNLDSDARWDPYDGRFSGYTIALGLWDNRGDRLNADYRYTRETAEVQGVESINVTGVLKVTRRWRVRGKYEYNLFDDRAIETGAGVSYQAQCWAVDVDYKVQEDNNQSISFMIHLTGLGSIGY